MTTIEVTYRVYEDKDLNGVLLLWEKYSGWGAITYREFEDWYLKTPFGPCLVVVAEDDNKEIVGQIVFFPSIIYIDGKEVKACRASAPILNPNCRQDNLNKATHPALLMIRHGMEIGRYHGYEVAYSFPSQGWATLLKAFPKYGLQQMQVALYDCFAISLETAKVPEVANITINLLAHDFSEEYDRLWEEATQQLPIICGIKRNAKWLQWKISHHAVFEVRSKSSAALVGYTAVNKKSGLLVDMLARTPGDLQLVLRSTVHFLQYTNKERHPLSIKKLTGMLTSSTEASLSNIPYQKENFTFAFSSSFLQDVNLFEKLAPSNWYMMPND